MAYIDRVGAAQDFIEAHLTAEISLEDDQVNCEHSPAGLKPPARQHIRRVANFRQFTLFI